MAIDGVQSPGNAWNEYTDTNLKEQKAAGSEFQSPSMDDSAMVAGAGIPFEDPKAVSDAKPAQIFFGDANPLESGVEQAKKGGGEPESTAEILKSLIDLLKMLLSILGGKPPAENEDSSPAAESPAAPSSGGGSADKSHGSSDGAANSGKSPNAHNASGSSADGLGKSSDAQRSNAGSDADGENSGSVQSAGSGIQGGAAGSIDDSGLSGNVSQTPGGKQITDGPNEGQKLHRTGLSGYENANGVESFSAAPGGELSGSSSTSRSEAYYSGDTSGKSFAADYKADVEGEVTIFQMKDNKGGSPEFRVTVDDQGDVVVNTGDGSPEKLGTVAPGEEFRLSVKDNADGSTSFGLNDTSGASLGEKTLTSSNPIDSTQFRYGAYTQGDNTTANVKVSNVETDI